MSELIVVLKKVFGQMPILSPGSPEYKELCSVLNGLDYRNLKDVRDAQIKHVSALAARVMSTRDSGKVEVKKGLSKRKAWTYLMGGR